MLCTLLLPTPILAWQPVDLYPREAIGEISKPEAIQRGCVLLEQVLQKSFANQQPATTDRAAVLHIDLRDDWHGVTSEHIPPWPPTDQRLQLRFSPHSIHGEIEFANGPLANEIWGVEGKRQGSWGYDVWQSFTRDASGAKTSGEEQEKAFIINAYRTMFELPQIVAAASHAAVITATESETQSIECIFATWDSARAQMENDQFLIWVDTRTQRIKAAHYTLRALAPDARAELNFISFSEDARGVFPTQIECVLQVHNRRYTHRITVEDYHWEIAKK